MLIMRFSFWKNLAGERHRRRRNQRKGMEKSWHSNLMYFAGDSMRQAVAMSVANQAKENMGFDITVEKV